MMETVVKEEDITKELMEHDPLVDVEPIIKEEQNEH